VRSRRPWPDLALAVSETRRRDKRQFIAG
jgi:hypothetical protein